MRMHCNIMASNATISSETDRHTRGSCLCGKVTFEIVGEPFIRGMCHCINCKRTSGAPFSANCYFPLNVSSIACISCCYKLSLDAALQRVTIRGEEHSKTYIDGATLHGSKLERVFCATCGSSYPWEQREGHGF